MIHSSSSVSNCIQYYNNNNNNISSTLVLVVVVWLVEFLNWNY